MNDTFNEFLQSPVIIKALSLSTTLSEFLNFCSSQSYNISNQAARKFLKIPSEIRDDDCILYVFLGLLEFLHEQETTNIECEELQGVNGGINYVSAYNSGFVPISLNVANSLGQVVSNTITQVQAANNNEQLELYAVSQRKRIDDYKKSLLG